MVRTLEAASKVYIRMTLFLNKCCVLGLRKVLMQCVERSGQSMEEHLKMHKSRILDTATGQMNEDLMYPHPQPVKHWDASLVVCVLEHADIRRLPSALDDVITELRNIRNRMCYDSSDADLEETDYLAMRGKIQFCLDHMYSFLDETDDLLRMQNEIDGDDIDKWLHSVDECYRQMFQWYRLENSYCSREIEGFQQTRRLFEEQEYENREEHNLTREYVPIVIKKAIEEQNEQNCVTIMNGLKEQFKYWRTTSQAVNIPEIAIAIASMERGNDEKLVELFKDNIEKRRLDEKIDNAVLHELRYAVKDAYNDMQRRGQHIETAKRGSILLRIRCESFPALVDLLEDCMSGLLTKRFKPIETAIRKLPGFENYTQEVVVYRDEFIRCTSEIVQGLKEASDKGAVQGLKEASDKGTNRLSPEARGATSFDSTLMATCSYQGAKKTKSNVPFDDKAIDGHGFSKLQAFDVSLISFQKDTRKEEQFSCLTLFITDICPDLVLDVFMAYIDEVSGFHNLQAYMKTRKPHIGTFISAESRKLSHADIDVIFPISGEIDQSTWDIKLRIKLLYSFFELENKEEEAALDIIWDSRKYLAHVCGSFNVSDDKYSELWNELQKAAILLNRRAKGEKADEQILSIISRHLRQSVQKHERSVSV